MHILIKIKHLKIVHIYKEMNSPEAQKRQKKNASKKKKKVKFIFGGQGGGLEIFVIFLS